MSLLEGIRLQPPPATQSESLSSRSSSNGSRRSSEQFSQFSDLARSAMLSRSGTVSANSFGEPIPQTHKATPSAVDPHTIHHDSLKPPVKSALGRVLSEDRIAKHNVPQVNGSMAEGHALSDTPLPTAPSSPQINARPRGSVSGSTTPKSPRIRATTLDVPGLTRSKVSPDGRIAERDVGAKLIIIMVGLPARGKSYIVKKIARYLNWLQHPTRIFNVGDRRRVAAGTGQTLPSIEGKLRESVERMSLSRQPQGAIIEHGTLLGPPAMSSNVLVNNRPQTPSPQITPMREKSDSYFEERENTIKLPPPPQIEQDSKFFDPDNQEARQIREQVAHETMDELLKYVLEEGGSVGIIDATNHTQERRMSLFRHVKERDSTVNVMFLESRCQDKNLLESNMRLKLSGPDYKDKDPIIALRDFQERVVQYEKKYQTLGDYEEANNLSYCSMIDVGRKLVSHKVNGFLPVQLVTYLMNFNLAPRQIWLTRHGESVDNMNGKIGGDSHLSPLGVRYGQALAKFIAEQRALWDAAQIQKAQNTHFPPRPGDTTPPNPEHSELSGEQRNFCVWTSMLKRSIESSQFFNDEDFDIKQMKMVDELNAGSMEGMTYSEIKDKFPGEYELRKRDKLHYRYPGPGGEGYLDVINRLRKVILEIERTTDHVLIIGHRSVTRVLLAYFLGLTQEDISDLDVPLGVVYMLEPRPYGVDFRAYRWNPDTELFVWQQDYRLRRAIDPQA